MTTRSQGRLRMAATWHRSDHWWPGFRGWPQPRRQGGLGRVGVLRLLSRRLPRPLEASHMLLSRPVVSGCW